MSVGLETWISDSESFFAHIKESWGHRHTRCGIALGGFYATQAELQAKAKGKPKCSACQEGVRILQS